MELWAVNVDTITIVSVSFALKLSQLYIDAGAFWQEITGFTRENVESEIKTAETTTLWNLI